MDFLPNLVYTNLTAYNKLIEGTELLMSIPLDLGAPNVFFTER